MLMSADSLSHSVDSYKCYIMHCSTMYLAKIILPNEFSKAKRTWTMKNIRTNYDYLYRAIMMH